MKKLYQSINVRGTQEPYRNPNPLVKQQRPSGRRISFLDRFYSHQQELKKRVKVDDIKPQQIKQIQIINSKCQTALQQRPQVNNQINDNYNNENAVNLQQAKIMDLSHLVAQTKHKLVRRYPNQKPLTTLPHGSQSIQVKGDTQLST